jgi:hypothetical protein
MDVIEHLAGRIGLGQTLHEVDELASHRDPLTVPKNLRFAGKFAAVDVAAGTAKGNRRTSQR